MSPGQDTRSAPATLDGRRFDGVVLEPGKTDADAETLTFDDGCFRSSACDRYGYGPGAYHAQVDGDVIRFDAETESPQYGLLRWQGTVAGHRLDGTLTMLRDGAPAGQKWVLASEG